MSPLVERLCRLFCEAAGVDPDAPPKAGKPGPAWTYEADYAREAIRLVLAARQESFAREHGLDDEGELR